jgi:hypothetical protein
VTFEAEVVADAKRMDDLVEYRFLVRKTHIWTLQMRLDVPRDQALLKRKVCYGAQANAVKGRGGMAPSLTALLALLASEGHNVMAMQGELEALLMALAGW